MNASLEAGAVRVNQTEGMISKHRMFRRFEKRVTLWDRELERQTDGRDLFLRPVGEKVDVVWCRPHHVLGWIGHRNQPRRSEFNPNLKYWKSHPPYRFCPVNQTTELFLREGHGFYRSTAFPCLLRFSLPHHFFGHDDPLTIDAAKMRDLISDWKEGDDFALLEKLALDGRTGLSWLQWERGSWEELEPLLQALLVLREGRFYFVPNSTKPQLDFKSALQFAPTAKKIKPSKIAATLNLFFEARTSPELKRLYHEPEIPSNAPMIEMKSPARGDVSQHERLEALLLWRDFLRDKLPPEEIAALLTPFST